jgi:hypothetical protein
MVSEDFAVSIFRVKIFIGRSVCFSLRQRSVSEYDSVPLAYLLKFLLCHVVNAGGRNLQYKGVSKSFRTESITK